MKKLFMFLAVAGLATFGASCSKSDDGGGEITPPVANELKLSANPSGEVFEGTNVTFSVISGKEMIKDAVITDQNNDVVKDGKWVAKEGTFKFKAAKKDYKNSNEVTIVVKKKVMKVLKLSLVNEPAKVTEDTGFEVKVVDDKNNPVDGAELYAGGQATGYVTENGVISGVMAGKGTYKLTVVLDESVSNEITVIVNAGVPIVGQGTITFDGKSINSTKSYFVFLGLDYTDDSKTTIAAFWQEETYASNEAEGYSIVVFTTAATPDGEMYSYEFPNETNITTSVAVMFDNDDKMLGEIKGPAHKLKTTYKISDRQYRYVKGDLNVGNDVMNGKPFALTFTGVHGYFDASNRGAQKISAFQQGKRVGYASFNNEKISNKVRKLSK